ncbi:glycosyl transferase family 1 [Microvirga sp. KLBC 81]|uniref:rhamnosyltransferase WsaF family glycosyltransferase n=1 Tax=Microvirga sp. KLBC 81 TaxID=1862707 RepID=UPI000D51AA38|nr:glycosyltransferase family 4 protein [Microvirga sp. KLBC 81]PVE26424.1 glycosyl transferase family 1 [Microvirga sp. KLBC 81]
MRIAILSPAPIKGSGGLRTIFSYGAALMARGSAVDVVVIDPIDDPQSVSRQVTDFYTVNGLGFKSWPCDLSGYDVVIATRWDTAVIARDSGASHRLYLVQDYEAGFNPMGDGFVFGEASYLYGLQTITLGRWLSQRLKREFGNTPYSIDFGVDRGVYRTYKSFYDRELTVCAIVQPEKPRRCTRLALEALGIVKARLPKVRIRLFGGEPIDLWFETEQLGIISPRELAGLYNEALAGLCISSSNPSRVPFEMMSCGLPTVDLYRNNTIYDFPSEGMLLAHQTPESIASALIEIVTNEELAYNLSQGGQAFMEDRPFQAEAMGFANAVYAAVRNGSPNDDVSWEPIYYSEPWIADVYQRRDVEAHMRYHRHMLDQP